MIFSTSTPPSAATGQRGRRSAAGVDVAVATSAWALGPRPTSRAASSCATCRNSQRRGREASVVANVTSCDRQRCDVGTDAAECSSMALPPCGTSRRMLLAGLVAAGMMAADSRAARADQALPKAYRAVVEKIIKSLRDSLDAEAFEASETEVRRKADPAKENIKQFVSRWRDDPAVTWHPSHGEILAAIMQLGAFYAKAGSRARMDDDTRTAIYARLDAAEAALAATEPPKSDRDGLLGLFPSS